MINNNKAVLLLACIFSCAPVTEGIYSMTTRSKKLALTPTKEILRKAYQETTSATVRRRLAAVGQQLLSESIAGEKCAVCLEQTTPYDCVAEGILSCGHEQQSHQTCLEEMLNAGVSPKCPICRAAIKNPNSIPNVNLPQQDQRIPLEEYYRRIARILVDPPQLRSEHGNNSRERINSINDEIEELLSPDEDFDFDNDALFDNLFLP